MNTITKEQLIEELKASTQNASGMFEISEDTICALMSMLTSTAPQLPQPAVLSVSEGVLKSLLPDVEKSEFWFEHNGKIFFEGVRFNNAVFEACRAAMLQGVDRPQNEPQNIPENIPATQFKPVADLYGLTSPTGGETSFTFDAVEARDFIDGGWSCQEYVELERFQEAITNHTEDKLAMVDHSGDSNNMVEPVTTAYKLPPHIFRELVNRLRDTAVKYQGCQQLREQLSRTLQEVIQPAAPQQEA